MAGCLRLTLRPTQAQTWHNFTRPMCAFRRSFALVSSLCGLCLLGVGLPARAASISTQLGTAEKQQLQREARLVVDLLQNHHYSGRAFREIENKEMVTRFLEELDPAAEFLTADDVEYIHQRFDRTFKSVYLFRGDLQPAFEIFDLFAERIRERVAWTARRLTRDFDLTADESYAEPIPAKAIAAGTSADLRWEQRLKDQVLREIILGRNAAEAREAVNKYYADLARRVAAIDSFAVRERFFDAIIRSFDPHSGYFSADSAREFAVDMENAVVGLGLDLRKEEGRCLVSAVQPGSPADLHSSLAPGDTIVALADGDGPWIDAKTKRLREIVALMRGEIDGRIRLAYLPEGTAERTEVTLERARVVLGTDRVHGAISIVPGPAGPHRIGWIVLPAFYSGGEGVNHTSAARDMHELLDQMAAQHIEGLVLDLRTNPGGALEEAVAISQLFLPGGTIMLSRGLAGKPTEHSLKEYQPAYTGPLVVLTSAQSASASEVFAGALKQYRRAVIVGEATTFGKGTVQAYIALAKLPGVDPRTAKDWGTLRLTTERFFLPDGQAVQLVGVPSQVVLPDYARPGWQREAGLPHALPAESITPPVGLLRPKVGLPDELLQRLRDHTAKNLQSLPEWELWRAEQQSVVQQYARQTRSLHLETRQKEWADTLLQFQARQRTRRELTAALAFPTQPLEIAAVQSSFATHEAKLRATRLANGEPLQNHLLQGGFFVTTDQDRLREVRLDDIGVTTYYGDTSALAAAFSGATGHPLKAETGRRILEELGLLEDKTDTAFLAAVSRVTGGDLTAAEVRRGTEALLRRLSELDGEMLRERPSLDVPLREAQRLTAVWAEWRAAARTP